MQGCYYYGMKKIILAGPILFAVVVITLSIIEYDFLRNLGWDPINDPTFDWPSGIALGPYGWIMILTFIVSGLLISLLAHYLKADLNPGSPAKIGTMLLFCAGLAMACLAFLTDPTIRDTPATWHGMLHDLSFVVLGLTLMPSMIYLGKAFHENPRWRNVVKYTWGTAALALPTFFLKGAFFYVFLLAILSWIEVIAIRLQHFDNSLEQTQ
jgi:hypothetical protein